MKTLRIACLPLCLLLMSTAVSAQNAEDFLRRGRSAYQSLEYPRAAALFRRALSVQGADALSDSLRAPTYTYLGATELFRARRAAADSAFLQALAADPGYRPDALVFPPEVTDLFHTARYESRFVKVVPPEDTTIVVGDPAYELQLYASARHAITVDLLYESGRVARSLYSGTIGDSMTVRWDGRTEDDREPTDEQLMIQVASLDGSRIGRLVRVPITVRAIRGDTMMPPPPPDDKQLLRERSSFAPAIRSLAVGVVGGLAAIALPVIVSDRPNGPGRFAVGASLGLAGIVGFIAQRPDRPLTSNIAANREDREEWRRKVEEVRAENAVLRRVRLQIRSGEPRIVEEETP
jgi:hypothetical protein